MKDGLFTAEEKAFFERLIGDGLLQNRRGVYWWAVDSQSRVRSKKSKIPTIDIVAPVAAAAANSISSR